MPPPPHPSQTRMTANPVRPARYRAGKPTGDDDPWASSDDDDDDEHEASDDAPAATKEKPTHRPTAAPPPKATSFPKDAAAGLKNLDLEARRRQGEEAERRRLARERVERERREREAGFVTESESEEEEAVRARETRVDGRGEAQEGEEEDDGSSEEENDDDDDDDGSSSEEESSSEDERPRLVRPVFVKKTQRLAAPEPDVQAALQAEEEARRRDEAANELVRERIAKDAIARAAGRAGWDDDAADEALPDDTDGLDPALEHREWLARELARLKRTKDALRQREAELEELERRRRLTSAEREAEDMVRVRAQQDERAARPKMAYLQKYRHKGAFYMDDEHEALRARDLMAAEYAGQTNKELLPQALRLRDDTKLGRKGATKYKDLRSEDTGRFGDLGGPLPPRRGGFYEGDERFRPDRPGGAAATATGANAGAVGVKRRGHEADEHGSKRPRVDG